MGAELVDFSPIHDKHLPADLDGILLYGGYPELNGEALERNASMKEEIAQAVKQGMPCMAECGGFMYLHEQMEDMNGVFRKTCGVIPGKCFRTPRLTRFGYYHINRRETCFLAEVQRRSVRFRPMNSTILILRTVEVISMQRSL